MNVLRLLILLSMATLLAVADSLPRKVRLELRDAWESKDPAEAAGVVNTSNLSAYIFERMRAELQARRAPVSLFRRDLQLGSLNVASGSTSVVARPGFTDLISAAIESGAFTRKTEGSTVTFGVNALPVYQLMNGETPTGCGSIDEACRTGPGRWIRGLSGALSLQPGTMVTPVEGQPAPGATPVAFLLGNRQLSAISARYEFFVRERKATEQEKALDDIVKELQDKIAPFMKGEFQLETEMDKALAPSKWEETTRNAVRDRIASLETMEQILLESFRQAYAIVMSSQEFRSLQQDVTAKRFEYIRAQNSLLAEKLYRKAVTFDYVHQRPSDQPYLHQGRFVFGSPLGNKPNEGDFGIPAGNLSVNAGLTWYGSTRAPGVKRLRDAQASMALDWNPRGWGSIRPTYTIAYYFQYMIENSVLEFDREAVTPGGSAIPLARPAIELLNTTGPIHVGQVRLEFPFGTTGVSLPFAVSYSNRTELIKGKPFWQGHVGLTYDFSKLKSLLASGAGGLLQ